MQCPPSFYTSSIYPTYLFTLQVIINERCVRAVVLINSGSLNYDFVWDMGTNPRVTIKPETGTVPKGERLVCEMAYHPHVPDRMRDYKISCQIINGGSAMGRGMQAHREHQSIS
jgi:hypothetical protein